VTKGFPSSPEGVKYVAQNGIAISQSSDRGALLGKDSAMAITSKTTIITAAFGQVPIASAPTKHVSATGAGAGGNGSAGGTTGLGNASGGAGGKGGT
jgi:hypothetical protein